LIGFESAAFRRGLRWGIAVGAAGGGTLALLLASPPARAEPSETGKAILLATDRTGATVTLYDRRGPCAGQALFATWLRHGAEQVPGCWIAVHGGVWVSFFDGERADIPTTHLRRAEAL